MAYGPLAGERSMSDETTTAPTPGSEKPWKRLLEDAATIESDLREADWEVIRVEPQSVSPVDTDDRTGFRVGVAEDTYDAVESMVGRPEVRFTAVDVYRQTEGTTTVVLAVERDDDEQAAVLVPLYYERPDAAPVFETALADGHLFVYLETESAENWVVFSHDDPSLFLENPAEFTDETSEEGGESGAEGDEGDEEE